MLFALYVKGGHFPTYLPQKKPLHLVLGTAEAVARIHQLLNPDHPVEILVDYVQTDQPPLSITALSLIIPRTPH